MTKFAEVLESALTLTEERAALAEELLVSLEELSPAEAERLWAEEAERRWSDLRAGKATTVSAEEVHEKVARL